MRKWHRKMTKEKLVENPLIKYVICFILTQTARQPVSPQEVMLLHCFIFMPSEMKRAPNRVVSRILRKVGHRPVIFLIKSVRSVKTKVD